ncbi:Electron transport complex protein RnfG [Pelotomaculum sp. FP]|uniref:RnfABCDGE type electron transport complex subunit G n=1 Tax=Pelotomaculum sp. FP TaxID=261474 RepID=UPI00106575A9|nr:RnfABCDGE type electron transport complex subunit G [Pelotomaculum sp. FP]TEB14144.1 Electron transport complex protein RnfG [Pelotomaculum sp. FP]
MKTEDMKAEAVQVVTIKTSSFEELIKPSLVLLLICLVVTAALAFTYQVTAPVIADINTRNANIARGEVLPQGQGSFSQVNAQLPENVAEVYKADNGAGMVLTTLDKGFGGQITVMVGIDSEGAITGVKVTKHSETPGLGTKAMTAEYLSQYQGQKAITRSAEPGETEIDAITGATISSNAIFRATETALAQYKSLGGAK